jgi:hypothetical protein
MSSISHKKAPEIEVFTPNPTTSQAEQREKSFSLLQNLAHLNIASSKIQALSYILRLFEHVGRAA